MMAVSTAMRGAVEAALRASNDVASAFSPSLVRLYPLAPPTNPEFPYVRFRIEVVGDDTECGPGAEVTVTFDVYAREATYTESCGKAEAISHAVRAALTQKLTPTGHVVDDWSFEFDRPVGDPDILTEHRSVSMTYLTTADA